MGILDKLFGGPKPDERDNNQLIFDIAEYNSRPADMQELFRRLPSLLLFSKVVKSNVKLAGGTTHVVQAGEVIGLQTVSLPNGYTMTQFFINETDERLKPSYIGMSAKEALQMTLKGAGVDGLILCNSKISWVALVRPKIEEILKRDFPVS